MTNIKEEVLKELRKDYARVPLSTFKVIDLTQQKMIEEFKEMIKEEIQLYKDEIKEMEKEGDTNISSYYEDLGALSELEELQYQLKDLEELKSSLEGKGEGK